MYGRWQWWWGEELRCADNDHYWKMYGLYIMGCSFIGYSKLILVDGPGEEDGPWAEGWEERSGQTK